jgi:hypothetical protein
MIITTRLMLRSSATRSWNYSPLLLLLEKYTSPQRKEWELN